MNFYIMSGIIAILSAILSLIEVHSTAVFRFMYKTNNKTDVDKEALRLSAKKAFATKILGFAVILACLYVVVIAIVSKDNFKIVTASGIVALNSGIKFVMEKVFYQNTVAKYNK